MSGKFTKADVQRLLKIDRELVEIELLIDKHLEQEKELNKGTLLVSKAYKYKYDRLFRMRTNLQRNMTVRLSRQETYVAELVERKQAVIDAKEKRDGYARDLAQLCATQSINTNEQFKDKYKTLTSIIRSQEIVIRNKQRAVDNWLEKDINTLPARKFYKPRQSKNQTAINLNSSAVIEEFEPENIGQIDPMSQLKNDPNWNKSPLENNATIDLLTRPTKKENNNEESS
jgi:hypothetical protein